MLKCRAFAPCIHCSTDAVSLRETLGGCLTSRIAEGERFMLSMQVLMLGPWSRLGCRRREGPQRQLLIVVPKSLTLRFW